MRVVDVRQKIWRRGHSGNGFEKEKIKVGDRRQRSAPECEFKIKESSIE